MIKSTASTADAASAPASPQSPLREQYTTNKYKKDEKVTCFQSLKMFIAHGVNFWGSV